LNSDGTVRNEYLTDEFDSTGGFTTIINNAKAKLATTTDPTEKAQLEATIRAATQAKALKTFSSPKYSKYAHEVENVSNPRTAEYELTDKQMSSAERIALGESAASAASAQAEAEAEYNKAYLGYMGDVYKADREYDVASGDMENRTIAMNRYNTLLSELENTGHTAAKVFVQEYLKPNEKGELPEFEDIITFIATEGRKYNIDKDIAEKICDTYGIDKMWLESYRDATKDDGNITNYKGNEVEGYYSGMVRKSE
jgi:hypothetical protein